jgi:hypothetical protein
MVGDGEGDGKIVSVINASDGEVGDGKERTGICVSVGVGTTGT